MRKSIALLIGVAILLTSFYASLLANNTQNAGSAVNQLTGLHNLNISPLCFAENRGQWDGQALFRADAGGAILWFTGNEVYYQFLRRIPGEETDASDLFNPLLDKFGRQHDSIEQLVIKAAFIDANPDPVVSGLELMEYKCNYFIGNNPGKWRTDVPNYQAIQLEDIYPGIDLKYYGNEKQMEYDFIVSPGADYHKIKIHYEGAESLSINSEGELVVSTAWGDVIERKPIIYQVDKGNRHEIEGSYEIEGNNSFSFRLDDSYNSALPLIIDPVLVYSTYLGGNGVESGKSIAVDDLGFAYILGGTYSTDFPILDPYQTTIGSLDIFITKLSSSGDELVYSTYLGGIAWDYGANVAIDDAGCAYITGETFSPDFPTQNPYQSFQGYFDAFVTKLSSEGNSLIYSTFLGGDNGEEGNDIVVDDSGHAYVTGYTISTNFPILNPVQTDQDTLDAFIVELSVSGNSLIYGTYLGGSGIDCGIGIAVDDSCSVYVTGFTYSLNFPMVFPIQENYTGAADIFVSKLSYAGGSLMYSTYIGGDSIDTGIDIAVDDYGCAYITGRTLSYDFPTVNSYQEYSGIKDDVCVVKLSSMGDSLIYSTLFGGAKTDRGHGIAIDNSGCAYVAGYTESDDYPIVNPYQLFQGTADVIVTKVSPSGNSLIYSTYLGGSWVEEAEAIAVDDSGYAYVVGETYSSDFPVLNQFQTDQSGGDVFVTKLASDLLGKYAVLALDRSGSMVFTNPLGQSRLERARSLAHDEIDKLLDYYDTQYPDVFQVAIMSFNADGIVLLQDFTNSPEMLHNTIDQISNPRHDTPLAAAMCQAHCTLTDLDALAKYVITFTDGLENESQNFDMCSLCEPCNYLMETGWNYDCDPSNPSSCTDWQVCLHEQFSQTGINIVHYFGEPINPFDKGNVTGLEDMYFLKSTAEESSGEFYYHSDQATLCGDANGDGNINVSDASFLINYIFIGGAAPEYMPSSDCNCDGVINVSDAIKIINYIFISGGAPCDIDNDSMSDC